MKYNDDGEELPDDTPVELPLRLRNNPGELSRINSIVRTVMNQYAESQDDETFEDAADFDTGEPEQDLFFSKYEVSEMQEQKFREVLTDRGGRAKLALEVTDKPKQELKDERENSDEPIKSVK